MFVCLFVFHLLVCAENALDPDGTTILEKCPWNTIRIFNEIKHVFLTGNIGYSKNLGLHCFSLPHPNQCCNTFDTH